MWEFYFFNRETKEEVFFYGHFASEVREENHLGPEWTLFDSIYVD